MNIDDPSTWNVLVVDDDSDNLDIANDAFTFFGAQVHTASNGQEALDVLKTVRPSFVMLDISMPVMDGWTTIRHIREDESMAGLAVIALTAHAMTGDAEKVLAAGFDGYITKPFLIDELLKNIQQCLRSYLNTNEHH